MIKPLVALSDGHGMDTAGKRTPIFPIGTPYAGEFMHENEFNRSVVSKLKENLERCGFDILLVSPGDDDTPLSTRTSLANNTITNKFNKPADIYVSCHANANTGSWGTWGGISSHIYSMGGKAEKLARICQPLLIKNTGLRDRGVCVNNFHEVRETNMPAVLFEEGFMDNLEEATRLKSEEYRQICADSIAQGICTYFNIPWVPVKVIKPIPETEQKPSWDGLIDMASSSMRAEWKAIISRLTSEGEQKNTLERFFPLLIEKIYDLGKSGK